MEKLITKSFKRLLDKGIHRGFITYEELSNSLGKRSSSRDNFEKAFSLMIGDIPSKKIEILSSLKKKYRLFLFSNINKVVSKLLRGR